MANVPFTTASYGTPAGILMYPDNYQAFPQTFQSTDTTAVTVGTRKVIKAGTIWPSNDGNARGVVMYEVDVTNGTGTGAILFEGCIKTSKLPTAPASTAIAVLPKIKFFGAITSIAAATITGLTAPVKTATPVALADITVSVGGLIKQSLTWNPDDETFAAETAYKAVIVLIAPPGQTISADLVVTIADATVTKAVAADKQSVVVTAAFAATAA